METSKQIFTQEKRATNSKQVKTRLVRLFDSFAHFDIMDSKDPERIKYICRVEPKASLNEFCTCPDFEHRSNEIFIAEKGHVLQCKHIIACKEFLGWSVEP